MEELLDDFQHQNREIPKDKELLRFEGLVPYILLDGTAVAEICILLDKANIVYGIENPSIQGNAATGITSAVHDLGVLLHVREEDKRQIDELVAEYEEQHKEQSPSSINPAKFIMYCIFYIVIIVLLIAGVIRFFL